MENNQGHRRRPGGRGFCLGAISAGFVLASALVGPTSALAAAAPQIGSTWASKVSAASATLSGELNPEGASTSYRFEYITDAAYLENLATSKEAFVGAAKAPAGTSASAGSGTSFVVVSKPLSALRAGTKYHYRLSATNSGGTTLSAEHQLTTQSIVVLREECANSVLREKATSLSLPDCRAYELVSPPDKNGGAIQGFEGNHGGGVLQASGSGPGQITYSSASSFGGNEALGAPPASQYVSTRLPGSEGWKTQNITTPAVSGSYGSEPNGVPYQLFAPDLARGLVLNGVRCRGEGSECPVANPPLPSSGAPAGYQDYYLRGQGGAFTALVTSTNSPSLTLGPEEFALTLVGASPDLQHVVLSTCAALTSGATEVPAPGGCDPAAQNLYLYSAGQLSQVNASPGASLPGWNGTVSTDGARVYFSEGEKLYLRDGSGAHLVAEGAEFQMATPDGSAAFFLKGGHLSRYLAASHGASDLTPSGGVSGMLGASADGSNVYFQDSTGLRLWHGGSTSTIATDPEAAEESDYLGGPGSPNQWGTARVTADGAQLLFLSKRAEALSGYDNIDLDTGQPDSEVYLFDAGTASLTCVSCNPTGERPQGASTIDGATTNGHASGSTSGYKNRALSSTGTRVFFDSEDALVPLDANGASDVYQWEASGTGRCAGPEGCLNLISSGNDGEGASFIDATESGDDVYFLTSRSLVGADPGSTDIYDARVGGGVLEREKKELCRGDACVPLPKGPEDPTVGTLLPGIGNPPVHFPKKAHHCPKGKRSVVRKGKAKCISKRHEKRRQRKGDR